ncbi:uncharacterized protein LOC121730648 [Aricia agestis]|uniref:uncharacterized protein LOC121730648 n=1 Tax=Aricia agestis TaxID=91739 RepID=UPI001C202A27|nr:uncharacterized protein LOC121730648 [Aricia agestis]
MAVCGLRTILLIVCIIQMIFTVQRQVFDFLGYMWLPIIANFLNILFIIFGCFGAVQYVTRYLVSYGIWSCMWLTWNIFLICYYLNTGSLDREGGLLSLGTGSVSWWESNGWGCQPVWGEVDGPGTLRPARVDGCFFQWHHVELAQSSTAALLTAIALPFSVILTYRSYSKPTFAKENYEMPIRSVYTIEKVKTNDTNISESSMKPMTPRRVKRRSGSRSAGSSVRRSRRSYRNAGYLASNTSLPRESRQPRPTSAHSSYSNFHAARPVSYQAPESETTANSPEIDSPPPVESVPILTNRYDTIRSRSRSGRDVAGPYNDNYDPKETVAPYETIGRYDRNYENRSEGARDSPGYGGGAYGYSGGETWEPPPPAPPYSPRATPQAPGPPAYHPTNDIYNVN